MVINIKCLFLKKKGERRKEKNRDEEERVERRKEKSWASKNRKEKEKKYSRKEIEFFLVSCF